MSNFLLHSAKARYQRGSMHYLQRDERREGIMQAAMRLALRGVGVGGSFDCAPRARACRRLRTRRGLRGGAVQFAILIDYEKERIQKDV